MIQNIIPERNNEIKFRNWSFPFILFYIETLQKLKIDKKKWEENKKSEHNNHGSNFYEHFPMEKGI